MLLHLLVLPSIVSCCSGSTSTKGYPSGGEHTSIGGSIRSVWLCPGGVVDLVVREVDLLQPLEGALRDAVGTPTEMVAGFQGDGGGDTGHHQLE